MTQRLQRQKVGDLSVLVGGAGSPFLFLHGIPGSAHAWSKVGEILVDHFRVIIPDLLGFGESDLPADDYYLESQARALRQLLVELGIERLYLAGHDFGGPTAITLMRLFPELTIKGLVLSNTNLFTDTFIPPPLRLASVPVLGSFFFRMIAGNTLGLGLMYLAATRQKSEATWQQYKAHLTPAGMEFTWRIFRRSLANLKTNYQAVQARLPQITCPTLILWGASDPFFGVAVGERSRGAIPNANLRIYERTGHFVPEEQPAWVAQDIREFFCNA